MRLATCTWILLLAGFTSAARADIVLYRIPSTRLAFVLEGSASANPGGTMTFRHPKYGSLYFGLEDVKRYELPSTRAMAERKLRAAVGKKDVEQCLEAARWALHHGLLDPFYEAASAAWKLLVWRCSNPMWLSTLATRGRSRYSDASDRAFSRRAMARSSRPSCRSRSPR